MKISTLKNPLKIQLAYDEAGLYARSFDTDILLFLCAYGECRCCFLKDSAVSDKFCCLRHEICILRFGVAIQSKGC